MTESVLSCERITRRESIGYDVEVRAFGLSRRPSAGVPFPTSLLRLYIRRMIESTPLCRRLSALIILPIRPPPLPTFISARTSTPTSSSVVKLARGHAACDSTCASLYGDRAETPYGNIALEGIYCKRPYPRYDYMTADSADSLYTDAYCQLICCSSLFFTPTLNVNSFILLTCKTQGCS